MESFSTPLMHLRVKEGKPDLCCKMIQNLGDRSTGGHKKIKINKQAFQWYKIYCQEALLQQRNNLPNTKMSILFVLSLFLQH